MLYHLSPCSSMVRASQWSSESYRLYTYVTFPPSSHALLSPCGLEGLTSDHKVCSLTSAALWKSLKLSWETKQTLRNENRMRWREFRTNSIRIDLVQLYGVDFQSGFLSGQGYHLNSPRIVCRLSLNPWQGGNRGYITGVQSLRVTSVLEGSRRFVNMFLQWLQNIKFHLFS